MTCTHCKEPKDANEFYINSRKTGRSQPCKKCIAEKKKRKVKEGIYDPQKYAWWYRDIDWCKLSVKIYDYGIQKTKRQSYKKISL